MISVGTIKEIWRYPVSSIGGQLCDEALLGPAGVNGDRKYALFDPTSGDVAAPEKDARWRPALFLTSVMSEDVTEIRFPNGDLMDITEPALLPMLQQHFGFEVAIGRYGEPNGRDGWLTEIQSRYVAAPIHLLTTASLNELAATAPSNAGDRRRFRPNLLVEAYAFTGFLESEWLNAVLDIGGTTVKVFELTKRCAMTFISQPGIEEDPEILRNIVRRNRRTLGVYCQVETPGVIAAGLHVSIRA